MAERDHSLHLPALVVGGVRRARRHLRGTPEPLLAGRGRDRGAARHQKVRARSGRDLRASGEPVPEPLADKEFSGRFVVRIPPEQRRARGGGGRVPEPLRPLQARGGELGRALALTIVERRLQVAAAMKDADYPRHVGPYRKGDLGAPLEARRSEAGPQVVALGPPLGEIPARGN